jgi:predicted GIY-YIG superfamily endonuclease
MVYLIHLNTPYKHARHYLGSTNNLERRLQEHREGQGARLLQVVGQAGIPWSVVRTWADGGYELEKRLKSRHNAPKLCPICREKRGLSA